MRGIKNTEDKFHQMYLVDNTTGCWNWQGYRDPQGYGMWCYKEHRRANRISAVIHNLGDITGMTVNHTCDNPSCVNPKHLYVGTHTENMRDAVDRKRHRFAKNKLTKDDIKYIRNKSDISLRTLAEQYGVSPHTIRMIRLGRTYKYVS